MVMKIFHDMIIIRFNITISRYYRNIAQPYFRSHYICLVNPTYFANKYYKHPQYVLGLYRMPFRANQLMTYFHVFILLFIDICLAIVHIIVLHQEYSRPCFGLSGTVFPHRLYPIVVKLQVELQILWTL